MSFITGSDLHDRLPSGTAVTPDEAQDFIDFAIYRLAQSHAPDDVPENAETQGLVIDLSFAKALELHYLKGEGAIEVPAVKDAIERAERAFAAYDAHHVTEAEDAQEAPLAIIEDSPF